MSFVKSKMQYFVTFDVLGRCLSVDNTIGTRYLSRKMPIDDCFVYFLRTRRIKTAQQGQTVNTTGGKNK